MLLHYILTLACVTQYLNAQLPQLPQLPNLPSFPSLGSLPSFLPTFGGVTIPCYGLASKRTGTCGNATSCMEKGSVPDGGCVAPQSCCVAPMKCGENVPQNDSYVGNTDYPNAAKAGGSCSVTVTKQSKAVILKLEFLKFDLLGPSKAGTCDMDAFWVEGVNFQQPLKLCGMNDGQHIYLPFDPNSPNTFKINVFLSSSSYARKWLIHIVQYDERHPNLPPVGCFQYLTAANGVIKSFNFNDAKNQGEGTVANLNYAVCIKRQPGYCKVQLSSSYFSLGSTRDTRQVDEPSVSISADVYGQLLSDAAQFMHQQNMKGTKPPKANKQEADDDDDDEEVVTDVTATEDTAGTGTDQTVVTTEIDTDNTTETGTDGTTETGSDGTTVVTNELSADLPNMCVNKDTLEISSFEDRTRIPFFCGNVFPKNVILVSEPFVIRVRNTGTQHGRGFALKYDHLVC